MHPTNFLISDWDDEDEEYYCDEDEREDEGEEKEPIGKK
jgi:hypothetical protein